MNTFLLRPDTHELFGDKLVGALMEASERLKGTASTGMAAGLRQFTTTIVESEGKAQGRGGVFDIDLFLHRTVAAKDQLEPVRNRLLSTVNFLQKGVFSFLTAHGTVGDAQVQGILSVCSSILDLGSEMRALCTTAGRPDRDLQFAPLLPVFGEIVNGIAKQLNERMARLDGLLTSPPPSSAASGLAATRAFVALFSVALTTTMVFASPPVDLTSLFLDAAHRPSEALLTRARTIIRGMASQCGQPSFEQDGGAPSTIFIDNNLTLSNEDQSVLRDAKFRGKWEGIGGEPNDIIKGFMLVDQQKNRIKASPLTGNVEFVLGKDNSFKTRQNSNVDEWASIGQVTGLWNEYERQKRDWHDQFLAPPHAYVATVLERKMDNHINTAMAEHNRHLAALLADNERRNVSPEQRMRDAAAIREVYERARKEIEASMPFTKIELDKLVRSALVMNPPRATRIDEFWDMVNAKEAEERAMQPSAGTATDRVEAFDDHNVGLEHRPPVDAAQIAAMFGQEVVESMHTDTAKMEPQALANLVRETLDISNVHGPFSLDSDAPPKLISAANPHEGKLRQTPLMEALSKFLGPTPAATAAVHCTSGGPFDVPPPARALAGLLTACMLVFPPSLHMFRMGGDSFMTMMQEELAKHEM